MPVFVDGLRLSQLLYEEAVKPILAALFPSLAYAAALIGGGSEILGYDTSLSADHDWGPRLVLFLAERDYEADARRIDSALWEQLPLTFHGYPTRFALSRDAPSAPPRHQVKSRCGRRAPSSRRASGSTHLWRCDRLTG